MKINGVGIVSKKEVMSILTAAGKAAVKNRGNYRRRAGQHVQAGAR